MAEEAGATQLGVSVEANGPVTRAVTVEVPAKRVQRAFERAYRELGRRVTVKGFRPGKAPRSVLERLYGESVGEDIERVLVSESLAEALEQGEVEPVSEPQIDASPPSSGEAFRYTATIEVKPEIGLPELSGLAAQRPAVAVEDSDVEEELEHLRQRRAPLVDEPEGTEAAPGHYLTIDYVGRIDGAPFEGGSGQGVTLELGSGRFIPGFEEQLEGASADDDREVRVQFPEDYGHEELAGQEALFAVHVARVQRRELPALDDSFAKEVGDFDSLEALRTQVREDIQKQREQTADNELRRTLIDSLLERTRFDVPPGMVERRLNQRLEMAAQQLGPAFGDELPQRLAQWREEWREQAERDVREHLVLEAVARERGFEASDEETDARLDEIARERGVDPERLRSVYEDPGMAEALRAEIASEKALDFLRSEAKVEEVSGS